MIPRMLKRLFVAALVAWAAAAAWLVYEARQTGTALVDTLKSSWPAESAPERTTREKLLRAAEDMRDGAFHRAASALRPVKPLSPTDRAAAERFFGQTPVLKRQFVAAAAAARSAEEKGMDVLAARDALARALAAAAARDETATLARIGEAERSLDTMSVGTLASVGGDDAAAVARLAAAIGPAYLLGQDLLTEGQETVGRLVGRAAWHAKANQFAEAAPLLNLAAYLLGVDVSAPAAATMPGWFLPLAQAPPTAASKDDAEAAVGLAEAMAASESPAAPVVSIIQKSRREADAGRYADARWWAGVGLSAMGMTDAPSAEAAEAGEKGRNGEGEIPDP